jgi:hypothetical protein
MTTNCQWCQSKLETYFSEELNQEDLGLFQAHLASCPACSREVQELRDIDPMMRQLLKRRLAQARAAGQWNTRPRVWKVALAGSGIALAAVLGIGMLALRKAPEPQIVQEPPKIEERAPTSVVENPKEKATPPAAPLQGKPNEGISVPPAPQPELDMRPVNGPDFAIIDASGEGSTLETYKGHVLLFGVVSSDQKDALANLQELYQAFGSNPNVRILGVANRRDDKFEGSTFPLRFNHASKLLGVQNGQFVIVDTAGSPKLRGSLSNATDVTRARTQLGQLGQLGVK